MTQKIGSPAELAALAEKAKAGLDLRSGPKEMKITVHMGTCGIAAGARDVIAAMMAELAAEGVANATLHQTGCAGLCDEEPMATLTDKEGAVFRYGHLDKAKAREIVHEHVLRGVPLNEYLIKPDTQGA
jgi:NADP-reducing hydrogenase subunit HndB